jgi:glyoxylase-like metal-dependent hydrolase (beta-lactamase superfamily II)
LPYCGGLQVIFTPGHAPGHICLYLKESKTLIAGDAMICSEGNLRGPVQQTTLDMDEALQSLNKLASFEIEQVICYHGGLYQGNVNERIAEIAR